MRQHCVSDEVIRHFQVMKLRAAFLCVSAFLLQELGKWKKAVRLCCDQLGILSVCDRDLWVPSTVLTESKGFGGEWEKIEPAALASCGNGGLHDDSPPPLLSSPQLLLTSPQFVLGLEYDVAMDWGRRDVSASSPPLLSSPTAPPPISTNRCPDVVCQPLSPHLPPPPVSSPHLLSSPTTTSSLAVAVSSQHVVTSHNPYLYAHRQ
ncbi:hypothetical protein Droror1_Dr00016980 [Drosera rotundifolia]